MDGAQLIRQHLRIRQPLAVRRPCAGNVAVAHLVGVLRHLHLLRRLQVHVPKPLRSCPPGRSSCCPANTAASGRSRASARSSSPRPRRSAARICSAYSPDSSERYAMLLPSGDHCGSRSITPGRIASGCGDRPSPPERVMISPRAVNTRARRSAKRPARQAAARRSPTCERSSGNRPARGSEPASPCRSSGRTSEIPPNCS